MACAWWTSRVFGVAVISLSACGSVKNTPADATSDGTTDNPGGGSDAALADVTGTVLDVFGTPLADAHVRIGADMITTGGDGQFHFAAVPPSYDLDVVTADASGVKQVTGYRGLTSRTPEVGVSASSVQTAPVSGSFAGVTFPLPSGQHIALSDTEQYFGFDQPTVLGDITTSSFSGGTGVWFGKPMFQGTIWAVQYTQTGTAITGYNAYSRIATSMTAGTAKVVTVVMTPLSTATVSGTVSSVPPAAGSAGVSVVLKHASDPFGHFVGDSASTTSAFSLPAPSGGSISVNVVASASSSSGGLSQSYHVWKANVPSSTTNVSLAFGTAAAFGAPANSATGVKSDATFSWSAGTPAGAYKLDITCAAGSNYAATIFTTGTSVKLSDTAPLGAVWPLTKACTWTVTLYGTVTSVDGAAVANARNKLDRFNGPVDGSWTMTSGFGFTTE